MPDQHAVNNARNNHGDSPQSEHHNKFLIPSPVPTRRNRTYSASERALKSETLTGKVKEFCRNRGHGFIVADETKDVIFVHISDIDGEYVPKPGDDVTFKLCPLPFNPSKKQAVHVKITHLAPGVSHEMWNSASSSPTHSPRT